MTEDQVTYEDDRTITHYAGDGCDPAHEDLAGEPREAPRPSGETALDGEATYGLFPGGDPRRFSPDEECCSAEEIARWRDACAAADLAEAEGRAVEGFPPGCMTLGDGSAWDGTGLGIGVYTYPARPSSPTGETRCACEEYWPGQGHHPECPNCQPTGETAGQGVEEAAVCSTCGGTGRVDDIPDERDPLAPVSGWPCPDCARSEVADCGHLKDGGVCIECAVPEGGEWERADETTDVYGVEVALWQRREQKWTDNVRAVPLAVEQAIARRASAETEARENRAWRIWSENRITAEHRERRRAEAERDRLREAALALVDRRLNQYGRYVDEFTASADKGAAGEDWVAFLRGKVTAYEYVIEGLEEIRRALAGESTGAGEGE